MNELWKYSIDLEKKLMAMNKTLKSCLFFFKIMMDELKVPLALTTQQMTCQNYFSNFFQMKLNASKQTINIIYRFERKYIYENVWEQIADQWHWVIFFLHHFVNVNEKLWLHHIILSIDFCHIQKSLQLSLNFILFHNFLNILYRQKFQLTVYEVFFQVIR